MMSYDVFMYRSMCKQHSVNCKNNPMKVRLNCSIDQFFEQNTQAYFE